MNVDGAIKNSLTSGGGIARNSEGEVMGGFSCPFDYDDILAAELDAILEGVKMILYQKILGLHQNVFLSFIYKIR